MSVRIDINILKKTATVRGANKVIKTTIKGFAAVANKLVLAEAKLEKELAAKAKKRRAKRKTAGKNSK